jgi:hypothetical protein
MKPASILGRRKGKGAVVVFADEPVEYVGSKV